MGSPLSPIVANLYTESLEEEAIRSAPLQPKLWRRYVDDTFVIWPHGQEELHRFLQHLNDLHPNIHFTMEEENECTLSFLDVLITRSSTSLFTSVYRKPTHTERYIPFNSHHHPKTITGVLRCMKNRAPRIQGPRTASSGGRVPGKWLSCQTCEEDSVSTTQRTVSITFTHPATTEDPVYSICSWSE